MLWLILDKSNEQRDQQLARHVLRIHSEALRDSNLDATAIAEGAGSGADDGGPLLTTQELRTCIAYVSTRDLKPCKILVGWKGLMGRHGA